jgi:hypothetical protein
MNIVKNIDQYDKENVFYCDPIKNNIMNEGLFIRIIYSTPNFSLNGISLLIHLNDVYCEKYYNKYKCIFNTTTHREIIEKIKVIEENILRNANLKGKMPQYKIYEQLKNGNIKIISDISKIPNNLFMLKISGIWENETQYGLTYKFIKLSTAK